MSNTLFNYFKKVENTGSPAGPATPKANAVVKSETPSKPSVPKPKTEALSSKKEKKENKENNNKFKMNSNKQEASSSTKTEGMDVDLYDDEEQDIVRPIVKKLMTSEQKKRSIEIEKDSQKNSKRRRLMVLSDSEGEEGICFNLLSINYLSQVSIKLDLLMF